MNYTVELSQKEIIQRIGRIAQALLMGYPMKCSNGMTLQLDREGFPFILSKKSVDLKNWEDCLVRCGFEVDTVFLYKEAQKMSDSDYFKLTSFITINENKYPVARYYKVECDEDIPLYVLLPHLKITCTGAEVKRLICCGAVQVNHEEVIDVTFMVSSEMLKKGFDLTVNSKEYRIQS